MPPFLKSLPRWLFGAEPATERLVARWLFLRALGLIFFSAFYSLAFQARGLIGAGGLLPAGEYLQAVKQSYAGAWRFWYAPTLLWFRSGDRAIEALVWMGLVASALLVLNIWPRAMIGVCTIVFLSFLGALQAFSSYQSDGMLMGAGFISFFFAPPAFPRQLVSAAFRVVYHLLRIPHRQDHQRRSRMAAPHRHGQLLPKRAAAHVDRLVRTAFAALVSRRIGRADARA